MTSKDFTFNQPWPFSFEVKNKRVTSVRITDPEYR